MSRLRNLLVLGRVSNLPTVLSNCLAGWWLGGGAHFSRLPLLFVGASLLYAGGSILEDATGTVHEREFQSNRRLPSGAIPLQTAWLWGLGLLGLGAVCLIWLGTQTGVLALAFLVCILAYDAWHKWISFSPVLLGICRMLLYVIAASIAANGVTGWAIWCGLVIGAFVVGVRYLARAADAGDALPYWPLILLATPLVLAAIMNTGTYRQPSLLLSLVLALWVLRSLRPGFWSAERNSRLTVSNLLAGIVFADWLAAADASRELSLFFILLFGTTLILQRYLPAT